MKKVYFHTLGCRVNQYDSETLRARFAQLGFESVSNVASANVCVLNTCSVTAESDRKCRSQIRRLRRRNPCALMVVTGCYAEGSPQQLEAMPEVDLIVGVKSRELLPLQVLDALGVQCPDAQAIRSDGSVPPLTTFAEHTRAFVKIEDGCDQMCSYCKIPFYRGRARSRRSEEVIQEIQSLSTQGYQEIVLCGIQLGAFGRDTGEDLSELLRRLNEIPTLSRLRLSSIEPDDLPDRLVQTLISLPKMAPHLHLPLQSGDDGVLRRMRRRYRFEDYRTLVQIVRRSHPHFAISTDVMVGFPGESEEAFQNSLQALREIEFCRLHLFRYSARSGTLAATYSDRVPQKIIDRRREEIGQIASDVVQRVRKRQIGRTLSVLLEEPGVQPSTAVGFSENYLRVQAILSNGNAEQMENLVGRLVGVRIETVESQYLIGPIVETGNVLSTGYR